MEEIWSITGNDRFRGDTAVQTCVCFCFLFVLFLYVYIYMVFLIMENL